MPTNPPPGWIELQERSKRAMNSEELSAIIEEMNQLLSAYEKAAGDGHNLGKIRSLEQKPASKKKT